MKKAKAAGLARERGWINAQKLIGSVSSASRDQKPIKESVLRHDGKSYLLSAYLMRSGVWWLLRTQPAPGKLVGAGMASTDEGETLNMGHSALLPEYRGKGLYQAVLRAFLGLYAGVCSDMTKTMTGASKRSWEQLGGRLRVSSKKVKPFFGMSPEAFEKIAPGGKIATERYCLPGAKSGATKHEAGQNPRVSRSAQDMTLKARVNALVGRGRKKNRKK